MPRKITIDRSVSYRILEAIGRSDLVNCRCRIVLPSQTQEVLKNDNGFIDGLRGYMLTGKHKEATIDLPPVIIKVVKTYNCKCSAYSFPHAPGLGKCKSEGEQQAPPGITLEELFE